MSSGSGSLIPDRARLTYSPSDAQGNFLRWLPGGNGHTFLYRPMFPVGPVPPAKVQAWRATLWQVDAATGSHKGIDLGVPSADLVDAAPSPDGSRIVYSTTAGLSLGSDTWLVNSNGSARKHLFKNKGSRRSMRSSPGLPMARTSCMSGSSIAPHRFSMLASG